jgi:hypothetical protein
LILETIIAAQAICAIGASLLSRRRWWWSGGGGKESIEEDERYFIIQSQEVKIGLALTHTAERLRSG